MALNVEGPRQLIQSGLNKIPYGTGLDGEGVSGEHEDELTLKLDDEQLLLLARKWEDDYKGYEGKIKPRQDANKAYYLGKQEQGSSIASDNVPAIASNLLFEAEETFLPAALSKNPEPVVWTDNTGEGTKLSSDVKTMLQYHADTLVLRRKLARSVRHWSIYFIGALKHGWDSTINDISLDVVLPTNFVFDREGSIDCYGSYEGEYLGERKKCTASKLVKLFPKHKDYIIAKVDGKMGTTVTYTEWWTDEYCFYTFEDVVLDKNKNQYFVYNRTEEQTDEDGVEQKVEIEGRNHFSNPRMPYTFLSVFSLGEQPHDITGLIEQNIPNQNLVTRRTFQIDYNLSKANNSDVFSENNFTQETAKQAAGALAAGRPVLIPSGGPIGEAIHRLKGNEVGEAFFKDLETNKQSLRSIFGTEGISSAPPNEDTTARGMILNQGFDTTRIGGGIGDALEQVADNVFNWWVQLYYVFYDDAHFAAVMGRMKAVEYVTLRASDLNRKLVVSVAADSMKPKDEITEMNQALSLWDKGAIDPKTLLTILNFPDPQQTAESTVLWLVDKNAYLQKNFPELAAELAQQQMAATGGAPGATPTPGPPVPNVPEGAPLPLSREPASAALSNVPLPPVT